MRITGIVGNLGERRTASENCGAEQGNNGEDAVRTRHEGYSEKRTRLKR
jgi:hypothetical protein